ncbi:MAG: hypothetical protein K0U98_11760 [Deltaproteobacteria bacterium]|nr:hypothetical protein [Deltaproteobacteria bacterium]
MKSFKLCALSGTAALLLSCFLLSPELQAQAPGFCEFTQLTDASSSDAVGVVRPHLGNRIAGVHTIRTLPPFGNSQWQVYFFDTATKTYTHATEVPIFGPGQNDLSSDDSTLAYDAQSEVLPGGNPEFNLEIFLQDVASGQVIQVTETTDGINTAPAVTGDGSRVAFLSNNDLVPGNNTDGNFEVFVYDAGPATLTQATDTLGVDHRTVAISDDGSRLAVVSVAPTQELQLIAFPSLVVTPVASALIDFHIASLDGSGNQVAFVTAEDLLPGQNADGNKEVFLFDIDSGLRQLTDTHSGQSTFPSFSANGQRIAFVTSSELAPPQSSGSQIVVADLENGTFHTVTNSDGFSYFPSLSADGQQVVFQSTADLVGENPDGLEIFLAQCTFPLGPVVTVPTLRSTGFAVLVILLATAATWRLRRERFSS